MKEKYGFVYIWFDKKHKRFYIGCRWGTEDDGYICSSSWMKNAYKRRAQDFRRRILKKNINKEFLLAEEHKWLSLIKDEELGVRYYNLTNYKNGHWAFNETSRLSVGEKISLSHRKDPNRGWWCKGKQLSAEHREKLSKAKLGHSYNKGRKHSDDHKKKNGDAHRGQIPWNKGKKRTTDYRYY